MTKETFLGLILLLLIAVPTFAFYAEHGTLTGGSLTPGQFEGALNIQEQEVVVDSGPTYTIDEYTELLVHCDGTDDSTTFTDESANNITITAVGTAKVDTSTKVFGTGSVEMGTGYLSLPNSSVWNPGAGDFTFDVRMRWYSHASVAVVFGRNGSSDRSFCFYHDNSNWHFAAHINEVGYADNNMGAWVPTNLQWYTMRFERYGRYVRVFANGTKVGEYDLGVGTKTIRDSSSVFYIGENVQNTGYVFNGWMDEIRWTKGLARGSGADYTPSTTAYPNGE